VCGLTAQHVGVHEKDNVTKSLKRGYQTNPGHSAHTSIQAKSNLLAAGLSQAYAQQYKQNWYTKKGLK
jgi:hypothetical protein